MACKNPYKRPADCTTSTKTAHTDTVKEQTDERTRDWTDHHKEWSDKNCEWTDEYHKRLIEVVQGIASAISGQMSTANQKSL